MISFLIFLQIIYSTFINFADERIALYGTVGVVKITDVLYSCSSRWLKTSICRSPRNPNLVEKCQTPKYLCLIGSTVLCTLL